MFFVSFCLCGAMSLSVYIYENVFCLLLFFFFFFFFFVAFWISIFVQHFGQQWLYYFVL